MWPLSELGTCTLAHGQFDQPITDSFEVAEFYVESRAQLVRCAAIPVFVNSARDSGHVALTAWVGAELCVGNPPQMGELGATP